MRHMIHLRNSVTPVTPVTCPIVYILINIGLEGAPSSIEGALY